MTSAGAHNQTNNPFINPLNQQPPQTANLFANPNPNANLFAQNVASNQIPGGGQSAGSGTQNRPSNLLQSIMQKANNKLPQNAPISNLQIPSNRLSLINSATGNTNLFNNAPNKVQLNPIPLNPSQPKPLINANSNPNSIITQPLNSNIFSGNQPSTSPPIATIQGNSANLLTNPNQTSNPSPSINIFSQNNVVQAKNENPSPPANNIFSNNGKSDNVKSVIHPSDISTNAPTSNRINLLTKTQPDTKIETKVQPNTIKVENNPNDLFQPKVVTPTINIFDQTKKEQSKTQNITSTPSVPAANTQNKQPSLNLPNANQQNQQKQNSQKVSFSPMNPEAMKLYLDNLSLKNLAMNNPELFINIIEQNKPIYMKLFLNLNHFQPSDSRQSYFDGKYSSLQTLGFSQLAYCNVFVSKSKQSSEFKSFLSLLIKELSGILQTDNLIAHYILNVALQQTKFYQKFVISNIANQKVININLLKEMILQNGNITSINYNAPLIRDIINCCLKTFGLERSTLLQIILIIMDKSHKQYRQMKNTAINGNIQSELFKSYKNLSKKLKKSDSQTSLQQIAFSEHQIIQEQFNLSRLLVLVTNRYLVTSKLPRLLNVIQVIKLFDQQSFQGSCSKYSKYERSLKIQQYQIELVLNLLPIDQAIQLSLLPANLRKNKTWSLDLYKAILNGKSEQMVIFKNLLPSVRRIYDMPQADPYEDHTLDITQRYAKKTKRWLVWLELFFYQPAMNIFHEDKTFLLRKVFNQQIPEFWESNAYPNIKLHIQQLLEKQDFTQIFKLFIEMMGTLESNSVEPVMAYLSNASGNAFMFQAIYKPVSKFVEQFRRTSLFKQKNRHVGFYDQNQQLSIRVAFLCKAISLSTRELRWIEAWLFSTPFSKRSRMNNQGTGVKLIMFLVDCIIAFKATQSFVILKNLFNALTDIISQQCNIKMTSVCLSICFYEYRREGSLLSLIDCLNKIITKQTVELHEAILDHLLSILNIPLLERYFIIPNQRHDLIGQQYIRVVGSSQIFDRYLRPDSQLQALNQLMTLQNGQSSWLIDLLSVLSLPLGSKGIKTVNRILQKLNNPCLQYTLNQFTLFSQLIDSINRSQIRQVVLTNLNITDTCQQQYTSARNNLLNLYNYKLSTFRPSSIQNFQTEYSQNCASILHSLSVIESSLSLIQICLTEESKLESIKFLIKKINLVNNVRNWLCDKENIFHFQHDFFSKTITRKAKFNLVLAIAAHFTLDYEEKEIKNTLFSYSVKQQYGLVNTPYFISSLDQNLLKNFQKIPQNSFYTCKKTISLYTMRVLIKCLLCWQKIPKNKKPSMYTLLSSADTLNSYQTKRYRQEIYNFFRQILLKLRQRRSIEEASQIVSFLITLLYVQEDTLNIIFQKIPGNIHLEQILQISITSILCGKKYDSSQMPVIHRLTIFISSLLHNEKFKKCALKIISRDFYIPEQILSALPRQNQQLPIHNLHDSSIDEEYVYNILTELRINACTVRYNIIQNLISMVIGSIIYNQKDVDNYLERIIKYLYLEEFPSQILNSQYPSDIILIRIKQYTSLINLPYKNIKFSNFLDANPFGFGRNFQLLPSKIFLERKTHQETNMIFSLFHKFNTIRSLEDIKLDTLKKWKDLFIVVASTGKYGYSLSHNLKNQDTLKHQTNFGSSFSLLNSKMFKTQIGFQQLIKPKLNLLCKLITILLSKLTKKQCLKLTHVLQIKLSMLEMALKWIHKLDLHSPSISNFCTDTYHALRSLLESCSTSRNSLVVASLFNTLCLIFRANKLNCKMLLQTGIQVYLQQDCVTRNIMISTLIPELSSKELNPILRTQLFTKMISLNLINNPDPMDYLISTRSLLQIAKVDQHLMLDLNYFSQLPSILDLNIQSNFYMQIWTFYLIKQLLHKQYNQYILLEIIKYLNRIELLFKSVLSDVTEVNLILIPKYNFEAKNKLIISIDYLSIYSVVLKIFKHLLQSNIINEELLDKNLKTYVSMFFNNGVLVNLNKVYDVTGEPSLTKIPIKKQSFSTQLSPYKKDLLQFIFEVQTLQCLQIYVSCLQMIMSKELQKPEHNIQKILMIFQHQIYERVAINISKSYEVKQMLECYNAYFSSLETAAKSFYTNKLKKLYNYVVFIEIHRDLLSKIYQVGKMVIEYKQNSLDVYRTGYQKQVKVFREWLVNGARKHKQLFRKIIK